MGNDNEVHSASGQKGTDTLRGKTMRPLDHTDGCNQRGHMENEQGEKELASDGGEEVSALQAG